jgi:hypothetical protein
MPEDPEPAEQDAMQSMNSRDIADRYRSGASIADISIESKLSSGKIRDILVSEGVEIRPRGGVQGRYYANRYVARHARRREPD